MNDLEIARLHEARERHEYHKSIVTTIGVIIVLALMVVLLLGWRYIDRAADHQLITQLGADAFNRMRLCSPSNQLACFVRDVTIEGVPVATPLTER